ncbi:hypothetical protein B5C34_15320 [Pacificimonas flava]|uniref:Uncharacterized protein n=2 Tax=Pacificimonas TaxID=1960290 RepID=A0A219B0M2_9SPHN|nr:MULTISPECIES: hypothetical protein [Pacificimonas]MBZ6379666.1 hypothetical protein [Pacificimonas aurantium]OWV31870.1 hypothetical protein B5C34_15320 [Pacificimonas flava]
MGLRQISGWVAFIAAGSLSTVTSAACWEAREIASAEVRYYQSMLMVGTLKCRTGDRYIEEDYNRFVDQAREVLDDHNRTIRDRFLRDYGLYDGEDMYDRFTTRLANDFAAGADRQGFCRELAALLRISASSHPQDVAVLAQAVVDDLPLRDPLCRDEGRHAYREASACFEPAPPRAAPPQPAAPAPVSADKPETDTMSGPAAPLDREAAMDRALKALTAAAEALRAVPPAPPASEAPVRSEDGDPPAREPAREIVMIDGIPTDQRPIVGAAN